VKVGGTLTGRQGAVHHQVNCGSFIALKCRSILLNTTPPLPSTLKYLSRLYTFRNNKEVETVVRGGQRMKQPDFDRAEISELELRWDKWMNVPGDGLNSTDIAVGQVGNI
jgi:hypothetical protein